MGKIKVLDKQVANMIAAGEVVERPASVVKELLENSIDAGATLITTEIKNGGIKFIRVMDNGSGMSKDDVKNSLIRHATSKIEKADDLDAIMTLGFRGEALASICAVSDMEIYTKTKDEQVGSCLKSRAGECIDVVEAGCPTGTTVIVRELFSETPARMKFLKKDYTEAGYIADIVNRLSLGMPHISFKFINNDKEQLFTSGDGNLRNAVRAVYGKDVADYMVNCDYSEDGVRAFGLCGKSEVARANRSMQNFFINGRYIKSALLIRAVEEAYKNELMTGKFPACVINIELSPAMVDINVHPTKLEAKFANESAVYHAVYWAVKNALYEKKAIPEVKKAPKPAFSVEAKAVPIKLDISEDRSKENKAGNSLSMREADTKRATFSTKVSFSDPVFDSMKLTFSNDRGKDERNDVDKAYSAPKEFCFENEKKTDYFSTPKEQSVLTDDVKQEKITEKKEENKTEKTETEKIQAEKTESENRKIPDYKICGQIFNTYIIVESEGNMLLVDQHAAHERLRYEKLLVQYEQKGIISQTLLMPTTISLTAVEFAEAIEYQNELSMLGFATEEFGDKIIRITAVPEDAEGQDVEGIFLEVLKNLSENKKSPMTEKVKNAIYQISCKGAIKANKALSEQEMKTLLDNVFALNGINTCPHGRPITISFTKHFIEKQFKRIV